MCAITTGVFAVYAVGACPHDLRRRQRRAGHGRRRARDPASHRLPALRPARKALDAARPARLDRLADEPLQRRVWRARVRAALPARPRGSTCIPSPPPVAALLLAVRPSFWGEANVQRVYTLNALFVVVATSSAVRWVERRDAAQPRGRLLRAAASARRTTPSWRCTPLALVAVVAWRPLRTLRRPRRWLRARRSVRPRPAALSLPADPLALRSAARLGQPGDASAPSSTSSCGATSGAGPGSSSPADLVPIVTDYVRCVAVELGWAGAALAAIGAVGGAPARSLAAAARRRWCSPATSARWRCTARATISSSGTATTSRRT